MTKHINGFGVVRPLQAACIAAALVGCASTRQPEAGSLEAIKGSQFMPIYQQCLRDNAPLRPARTSTTMLNQVAKACMNAAKHAVK